MNPVDGGAPPVFQGNFEEQRANARFRANLIARLNTTLIEIRNMPASDLKGPVEEWLNHLHQVLLLERVADGVVEEAIMTRFIPLLRALLTDALAGMPLGYDGRLGSDGRSYSAATLRRHRELPVPLCHRSPIDSDNGELFTTQEDVLVCYMLEKWLQVERPRQPTPAEERARQQRERVNKLREERQRRAQEGAAHGEEFRERAYHHFHRAGDGDEEAARAARAAVEVLQQFAEELNGHFNEQEARDRARAEAFHAAATEFENRANELRREQEELREQQRRNQQDINTERGENRRLLLLINETEQMVHNRKQNMWKQLTNALLVVGVCVLASWALPYACQAMGFSWGMSATPLPGGGQLNFCFTTP